MIENFTEDELKLIIKELKGIGYDVKQTTKQLLMKEETEKLFGMNVYVCQSISNSIFSIADFFTDNYERTGMQNRRKLTIPSEISDEYRRIVSEQKSVMVL